MTYYKPLTPKLREDIKRGISEQMAELNTCEQNGLVKRLKEEWQALESLINSLPDGFMMPMRGGNT